ncbi:hypothetical protein KKB18_06850, partial [bacterium]|nr:hypothetical protein [bacterium]
MIGLLPEGISDIIQKELKGIDVVRKEDIENLFRKNFSSNILISKDELSKLIADSISEFKNTLMGFIKKTIDNNIKVEKQRWQEEEMQRRMEEEMQESLTEEDMQPLMDDEMYESQQTMYDKPPPIYKPPPPMYKPQPHMRESKNKETRFYTQTHKFNKRKKGKGKSNKFKKFEAKKIKPVFHDKHKKISHENKREHSPERFSNSPVGIFLKSKNPRDKMQELKCLAFYLDQIDRVENYNKSDFHDIYKRANLKVPPVFDTLLRFLVKSDYLKISDLKKGGYSTWKITEKVIRE